MKSFPFWILTVILSLPISLSLATGAAYKTTDNSSFMDYTLRIDSNYNYSEPYLSNPKSLSLAELKFLSLQSAGYDDFLKKLSARVPAFFNNPVYIPSSGSIQASSFERPRVILFGESMMMSFSEPKSTLTRSVEVLNYDPRNLTYTASEIIFDGNKAKVVDNPKACVACHGSNLQPIWQPYDLWPQAYGSFAGLFSSETEKNHFLQFQKNSSQVGIYKFIRSENVQSADSKQYGYSISKLYGNDGLTQFLRSLKNHRFFRRLESSKEKLRPFRYALISSLRHCETNPFPSSILNLFLNPESEYQQNTDQDRLRRKTYLSQLYNRLYQTSGSFFDPVVESRLDDEAQLISGLRFLLENLGYAFHDDQTNGGPFRYGLSVPSNIVMDLSTTSVLLFPEVFQELRPSVQRMQSDVSTPSWAFFDCNHLAQRSRQVLASINDLKPYQIGEPIAAQNKELTAPLHRCLNCHASGQGSGKPSLRTPPFIPFDQQQALQSWMNRGNNYQLILSKINSGQMPLGSSLSRDEKQGLLEAIERIRSLQF